LDITKTNRHAQRPHKNKKQTSVGHHSAQTHLPKQLFESLFFAQTSHQPHRQFTKTILFFKLTAQKADARFLLKVLVFGHQTKLDFLTQIDKQIVTARLNQNLAWQPLTASKPNGGGRTSLPCVYGALRAFYSLQGKKTFVLL